MGRRPKGNEPMTANERKQVQRLRDKKRLTEAGIKPEDAPLRTLLQLVREGHKFAWQEIGRRNGWMKGDGHAMGDGIVLGEDALERLAQEAAHQGVPLHRLIEAILTAHLTSGKRVYV